MIDWWLIDDWWFIDDWLMIDWLMIHWRLIDDWLMIDWWLIDDSWDGLITVLTASCFYYYCRQCIYFTKYRFVFLNYIQMNWLEVTKRGCPVGNSPSPYDNFTTRQPPHVNHKAPLAIANSLLASHFWKITYELKIYKLLIGVKYLNN